jgi:transmembrane sensor
MNMSSPHFSSEDDAIETAAAEWLVERDDGFTPARAALFAVWRAADARHDAAVIRTERALSLIAELPAVRGPLESRLAEEVNVVRPSFLRAPVWAAGIAASLALAAGLWWMVSFRGPATQHYVTAAARQQQVALVDGSVLNLNVSSEVQVALTPDVRRVTLTAGEAHFAVAHDTSRPFIVSAGDVRVRAVGTAFSVRLGDQGVEVLVTEGKVEITRDETRAAPAPATPAQGEPALLVAGERTLIARDGPTAGSKVEQVSADAFQAAVRWHSQIMTFTDLPLRDAVVLFNRRNQQQLVLADAAVGERRIGGTFAADQVEAFVRLLAQDGDVAVERRSAAEIVLRRAP